MKSRKLSSIGTVLLAWAMIHAEGVPAPPAATKEVRSYLYEGRLGYRDSDGTFTPLHPDRVFVGWGDDGCEVSRQTTERLNFFPEEYFHLSIAPRPGKTDVGTETVTWPCYRFRVRGCDDGVVKFGPKPPSPMIEVNCPPR